MKVCMCVCVLSYRIWSDSFCDPMDCSCLPPLSMGFSRQEYWSGFPYPPPVYFPNPGIKSLSLCLLHWQTDSLPLVPPGKPPRMSQKKTKQNPTLCRNNAATSLKKYQPHSFLTVPKSQCVIGLQDPNMSFLLSSGLVPWRSSATELDNLGLKCVYVCLPFFLKVSQFVYMHWYSQGQSCKLKIMN